MGRRLLDLLCCASISCNFRFRFAVEGRVGEDDSKDFAALGRVGEDDAKVFTDSILRERSIVQTSDAKAAALVKVFSSDKAHSHHGVSHKMLRRGFSAMQRI